MEKEGPGINRFYLRFLILAIIIVLLIGSILIWADHLMSKMDQQMPVVGCIPSFFIHFN